uniref:FYVE-type domain-containing protein n=1 Tax=Globisporangium ultimum (strain ATCC 200006 / CBS 805.95 / DAOM BR144) TaxID=431595 RepID=K3W653_GLOUD
MSADQDGLLVHLGNQKKLYLSNDILLQDVTTALPILQNVLAHGVAGPQWRQRVEKEVIELYETTGTATEYAVAVKLDLKCHLNEAFNALVSDDAATYTAAMQGFFGKKFKKGTILHRFDDENAHTKALVKTATFANSLAKDVEFNFVDYRVRNLEAKSATRVTKSLPKEFHDRLSKSSVLGGAKEVIACTHVEAAGIGRTKVFFYASCSVDDESLDQKTSFNMNKPMNFLIFLAKSMTNFESVLRRRRLGFQSYIYSSSKVLARSVKTCKVCEKSLNVLRGDHYCQVCGFRTCSMCSDTINVEPKLGVLRINRICKQCVELTDRCLFEDLELDVLGSPIIAEVAVLPSFHQLQIAAARSSGSRGRDSSQSGRESDAKIVEYLFSSDRSKQSLALDHLGVSRLINTDNSFVDTSTATTSFSYSVFDSILRQFLSQPVRLSVADCVVAEQDGRREYLLNFEEGLQIPEVPPAVDNEQIRQDSIHQIGFLSPSFQSDAFNIICEIAAKVMDCRTAYVSVVTKELQYAIAHCNMSLLKLPRRETMCAYALTTDVPFIVRNASHDIRFRQFFCVARAGLKFYASFPIEAPPALGGGIIASLVVMDKEPKKVVTNRQYSRMVTLTKVISELLSALPRQ